MMVPIQVIRWYRMQCYDGTDSCAIVVPIRRYCQLKERLLSAYYNNDVVPGLSARQEIGVDDEWCAEAYMETDYSTLTENDFISKIKAYTAFLIQNEE